MDILMAVEDEKTQFYERALTALKKADLPFLIAGAYALQHYTGVRRDTKDLDLYLHPRDQQRLIRLFAEEGFQTELTAPHWLGKVFSDSYFIDLIFGLANGLGDVDDQWFARSQPGRILGIEVRVAAPEEIIWSKAFIMERERFDGADINHLLRACAEQIDWGRLLELFGGHWRVLFSHLLLFGFAYPTERNKVPAAHLEHLCRRLQEEIHSAPPAQPICQGTLLSRTQYQIDITSWRYKDARLPPSGHLTRKQITQ